jgi:hypothetical protein
MLTLDTILNGLTEQQMDLVVGSRVQAGNRGCGSSKRSHSKRSKSTKSRSCGSTRKSSYHYCW